MERLVCRTLRSSGQCIGSRRCGPEPVGIVSELLHSTSIYELGSHFLGGQCRTVEEIAKTSEAICEKEYQRQKEEWSNSIITLGSPSPNQTPNRTSESSLVACYRVRGKDGTLLGKREVQRRKVLLAVCPGARHDVRPR